MRLYLVRRTRTFIKENYAETDPANGRQFLNFETARGRTFPTASPRPSPSRSRMPRPNQYAGFFPTMWSTPSTPYPPRYGLGN